MTLEEAKEKYEGKTCDINWGPLDRPARPNEAISYPLKDVVVSRIFENCHREILFECIDKIYTPFPIARLMNVR